MTPAAETPSAQRGIIGELHGCFPDLSLVEQGTADGIPTVWAPAARVKELLAYLKTGAARPFASLYDLGGIDERLRAHRAGQPEADFTVFYHLLSYERNADLRLKVALRDGEGDRDHHRPVAGGELVRARAVGHVRHRRPRPPAPGAHPAPPWWDGHPLRKEAPSRGTELGPFTMPFEQFDAWQEDLRFKPEEWGLPTSEDDPTLMYLNIGPQHGATHGPLRIIVGLRDEEIVHCIPDIGFHHRGAEKLSERQTWHTFIPYTDRIDYLGGVTNNLPWVLSVEKLCGIEVPDRAQIIRVMLGEFFRISSHLVYYGTFAQDIGALSPVFYTFEDRERIFDAVIEPICGARMHPGWFRIGGIAEDLPHGWEQPVRDYLDYLPSPPRRVRPAHHGQPHHEGAHRRRRGSQRGRRRRVGRHRPQPARHGTALGLAQAASPQSL